MEQLDCHYKDLREQLYTLGFHQQLPIGSMSIVSALLEDLIKVTDSYRESKQSVNSLLEEKRAWNLGIEPYKCDNSRLLSENNALHLELIKARDNYDKKLVELKSGIRNLEVDKNYLEDHCFELASKVQEMVQHGNKSGKGHDSAKTVLHKKAFISTVRSGSYPHPNSAQQRIPSRRCDGTHSNDLHIEVVKLQNDNRTFKEETDNLKKQLQSRDREIARLTNQLNGGRPVAALGRDCCYRGIDALTEDIKHLQQQLLATKKELEENIHQQHEAKVRAMQLEKEKKKCTADLTKLQEVALKVQDEANEKLLAKDRELENILSKFNDASQKIAFLEGGGSKVKSTSEQGKIIQNMKEALREATDDNNFLTDKVEELIENELQHDELIKILSLNNAKLEEKVKGLQLSTCAEKLKKHMLNKETLTEPQSDLPLYKDKLLLQSEYLRRLNRPVYERELQNIQEQLTEREMEINHLKEQLSLHQGNTINNCHSSISIQSVMNRMEREAELSNAEIKRLTVERDSLKHKLQTASDAFHNDQNGHGQLTTELSTKIKQLESENRTLRESQREQVANEKKILRITDEVDNYIRENEELNSENRKLKTSCSQLRMLQEQTEKSLLESQNRLFKVENIRDSVESEISAKNSKLEVTNQTINNLKAEIMKLREIIKTIDEERSDMHNLLDTKTEQMFDMETNISKIKLDNRELTSKIMELKRHMSNKTHKSAEQTSTIQKATKDTEVLRKQIEHLQRLNDNLSADNSRLEHEVVELTCACNETKKRLTASDKEINRLTDSIKEYVQEVQKAEDLLLRKEMERDELLGHLNKLSAENVSLENKNQSLEFEATETKRCLVESESKIHHQQEVINERDSEVSEYYRQIDKLSEQLVARERELEEYVESLGAITANATATKDLCNKLDIEKDKLKEELNECMDIRRKLEKENEKLRKELTASSGRDKQGAVLALQELLTAARKELDEKRATESEKSIELQKYQHEIEKLKEKIKEEQENVTRHQALAQEYTIQIQELRHDLTNARFTAAVSKEQMQRDEFDRNKILYKPPTNGSRTELMESLGTTSNLHQKSNTSKLNGAIAVFRRHKPTLSEIKIPADYKSESSEVSECLRNKIITKTARAAKKFNKRSVSVRKQRNDEHPQNECMDAFRSSEPKKSFEKCVSESITEPSQAELSTLMQEKSFHNDTSDSLEKSENECACSSQAVLGYFQKKNKNLAFILPREKTSHKIKQRKTLHNSELRKKSILVNQQTVTNTRTHEAFFTCTSNSTASSIGTRIDNKQTFKQSNFDTSNLPPPPPFYHPCTIDASDQVTELNVGITSYARNITQFQANYVLSSTK